ncbi:MAG: cyclic nucleotide-binding domain-containing protein [Leptospiraceae bacterium]
MDFDLLTELSQPVEFRSGEKIYEMDYTIGDPCAYLILEGDVRVMRKYTPLKMENFDLTKGDLFGMLEVYLGTARITDAVARTGVRALGFSKVQFERAMVSDISFALQSIRVLSKMLRQINGHIKELPYQGAGA